METEKIVTSPKKVTQPVNRLIAKNLSFVDTGAEHPNTNIPFTANIDGRQFNGSSISLVSATISGLAGSDMEDAERIAVLKFRFGAYDISVPVSSRISRVDTTTGTLRLDFIEPAGEHLPALRYILNSYVAGEIVSLGGLISAREKKSSGETSKQIATKTFSQRLGGLLKTLATIAATIALVFLAGKLVMNRFFTVEVDQLATVSTGGEAMRALASGQIALLNPTAKKGEVVYAIRSVTGNTLNVVMPCDCTVAASDFAEGSTVMSGETILELAKPGAVAKLEVPMSAVQAKSLLAGNFVELRFADGTVKTSVFVEGRDSLRPIAGSERLLAIFALEGPLPEATTKAPVVVRIVNAQLQQLITQFMNRVGL